MDLEKVLQPDVLAALESIKKAAETVDTNTFTPADRSIFVGENLDEKIKLTVPGENGATMRARLPRRPGSGQATAWKRLTSGLSVNVSTTVAGTNTEISFADAGAPNETSQTFTVVTAAYKLLGRKLEVGVLFNVASQNRAGESGFADAQAERESHKLVEVLLGEEELIIAGDSAVTSTQFDGLGKQITTNSGTTSLLSVSGIGVYEETLFRRGSSGATAILLNPFQMRALSNQLEASGSIVRIVQNMGTGRVTAGPGAVFSILSPITGRPIDVLPSRYVQGNAFLLTEKSPAGEPWIEMEDLIPMSRIDIPSTNLSKVSFIYEASVLKVIGEPFQYELAGLALS